MKIRYDIPLRGYMMMTGVFLRHLWSSALLFFYLITFGIISLVRYLWRNLVGFTRNNPRLVIVMMLAFLIADHIGMRVRYRIEQERQEIAFDSLADMKDSIQLYSSYDSGYARGLIDANEQLKNNNNGYQQEKDSVYRP